MSDATPERTDFLRELVQQDLASGRIEKVVTRSYVDVKDHLTGKMKKQAYITTVTRITSDGLLVGSTVEQTWVDPENATGHALVCMDAEALRGTIKANLGRGIKGHAAFKKGKAEAVLKKLEQAVDDGVK